jgi:hypothetical protein
VEHACYGFDAYAFALQEHFVLARVSQVGHDGGDFAGAVSFGSVSQESQLHKPAVLWRTGGLYNRHMVVLNWAFQSDVGFSVWKRFVRNLHRFYFRQLSCFFA